MNTQTYLHDSLRTRFFTTLLALTVCVLAQAQRGSVDVECSSARLDSLLSINQRSNYNQTTLDGYRIQIFSASGLSAKKDAHEIRDRFIELFPREKVLVRYDAPFWRVKIGDYRSRSEAMALLEIVKRKFPGAYTIKDKEVHKNAFK